MNDTDRQRIGEILRRLNRIDERLDGMKKSIGDIACALSNRPGMEDNRKADEPELPASRPELEMGERGNAGIGDGEMVFIPTIEMIEIPGGPFLYGPSKEKNSLPAFEIAKYPLTNRQYAAFLNATGYGVTENNVCGWEISFDKRGHPAVRISYADAEACAKWYGMRLPTEQEWEKAARGTDGREYPWGNEFDPEKCNTREGGAGGTTPVDSYPKGASPYGVMDMAGNVWEWTSTPCESEENSRVLRGGSSIGSSVSARCSGRYGLDPDGRADDVGVRFSRTL